MRRPQRVVVDTNVFVSRFLRFDSLPGRAAEEAIHSSILLVSQWNSAKERLRAELWRIARVRRTITYGEAVAFIRNLIVFDPHDHVFHEMLVQISVEEDASGRGMLSAIVVHSDDGRPGKGFFDLARQLDRDISDSLACWVREVNRLYEESAQVPA